MAGRDGTSAGKEGVDFEWVGDGLKTKRFFTKAEKAARSGGGDKPAAAAKPKARTSTSTRSSAPASKPKRDVAAMASDAIDRTAPTRPKARPGTTRPKARPNRETATSVSTPEVTTSKLPARGSSSNSGPKGPSPLAASETAGPRGNKPFAGTKPTRAEWNNMTAGERVRWGVVLPPSSKTSESTSGSGTAGRRDRRAARRSQSGYAKGGMVKANCGASMKPTQKSTRKK